VLKRIALLLCLAVGLPGAPACAQVTAVGEYTLKSALLFKLPQFIYRQDTAPDRPLGICLLGSNPFGSALERLAQLPIDGREVRYSRLTQAGDASACDLLFISSSETDNLDSVLRRLGSLPVVTVSDIPGFARAGGMVELAHGGDGAAVSILINRKAARRQNIEFNAQLLRLAKVVEP
jgi:hypothetical protein